MPLEQAQALHRSRLTALRSRLAEDLRDRGRVTLEIGCGHGHFLTAYAEAHPHEYCLGIDLLADRLARAARKSARQGLGNVGWVQAEAGLLLEAVPAEFRFDANVFILFPDPWPKRRHWKNRLVQPAFLSALAARAGQGTRLCFRTDHQPYFEAALAVVRAHPDWREGLEEPWPFEQPTVFQSRADHFHSWVALRR